MSEWEVDDDFFDEDDDPDSREWNEEDEARWEALEAADYELEMELAELHGMSLDELLECIHEMTEEEAEEYAEVTFGEM